MAYICNKPKGCCPKCEHYRYDEDSRVKACWATWDMLHPYQFQAICEQKKKEKAASKKSKK